MSEASKACRRGTAQGCPGTTSGFVQLPDSALREQFWGTERSDNSLRPGTAARTGPGDNAELAENGD